MPALRLGCRPCDRQTQPGPEAIVGQTLELHEHAVARRLRDARSGVADHQAHAATLNTTHNGHRRADRSMNANVFQQVTQCLIEQSGVEACQRQSVGDVVRHRPFAEDGTDAVEHCRDDLAQGVPLSIGRDARVEARHRQGIADKVNQSICFGFDRSE